MATGSRRFTFQRSSIAIAALLVASMSVHDHRVAAIMQGASATSDATAGAQAAHPAKLVYASIGSTVAHHYPG